MMGLSIPEIKDSLPGIHDSCQGLKKETADSLSGPCPKCGGDDRFVYRTDTEKCWCRQCHKESMDIIDYHAWVNGVDNAEFIKSFGENPPLIPKGDTKKAKARAIPENIVAKYPYKDEDGKILSYCVRFEESGKEKDFRQWQKNGDTWIPNVRGIRRVPYRLPDIIENDYIIICEGEKDVENLVELGCIATTNQNGAGKWLPEFNTFLKGKHIYILPDNDEAGRTHAQKIVDGLVGIAASIRVIDLPGLDHKGDVSNWIESGGTKDQLVSLIESTAPCSTAPTPGIWDKPMDLVSLIDTTPEPHKWFCKERIIAGRGLIITGVGGSSKTRLLYHLAAGAILGRLPWAWDVSVMGRVVLVLTEDTMNDVHTIIHSLSISLGLSLEEKQTLYQSLIIYPLAGSDTILLNKTGAGTLGKSKLFLELTEKIKGLDNVAFVGMDPALSLTDGDELDQSNQRALGKMADDLAVLTGATVALITHATKGSLQQDVLGSHNSRGGGAITDAARTEFVMRTMTQKEFNRAGLDDLEEQFRHVQLVGTKGNYLPPSAYLPIWLRRDDRGMLSESDISFDQKAGPSERDIRALSLLMQLSPSSDRGMESWRKSCIESGVIKSDKKDNQDRTMKRIVKALKDSNLITKGIGKGIWIPVKEENNDIFQ